MKNVKWQGHAGKKESMSLEHFQSLMRENQLNDPDDDDDTIDQSELDDDAKKWFEEMYSKQRSNSVLV